MVCTQ